MTVRGANYDRRPNDLYETPEEAVDALLSVWKPGKNVCDPCCASGNVLRALRRHGHVADGDDIANGYDFINDQWRWPRHDVVTNPPYGDRQGRLAMRFVVRALEVARTHVAMLLPVDFDSGRSRVDVFRDCPRFAGKIVLLNRIRWFDGTAGSTNHAWFLWHRLHGGKPPTISYAIQNYPTP